MLSSKFNEIGLKMSAGIEPLKKTIRIWWKIDGHRERETLQLLPTPENIEKAKKIANMIATQIEMGNFDRFQVFPNSNKRPEAYFEHYINQFLMVEQYKVAQISYSTYRSKIDHHIRPYWSNYQIANISSDDIEKWVYDVLLSKLSSKTTKEIVMLWRKIYRQWARTQKHINDPSQYLTIKQADPEDINPFTKEECEKIINLESDITLKNLWTVLLWSGLSQHELIGLAITDLALEENMLFVQRSCVKQEYRVTKNRRRKRPVMLLPQVVNALQCQVELVKNYPKQSIQVTDRDNKKTKDHELQWLWYDTTRRTHFSRSQIDRRWKKHLEYCGVKYRPLNNGRHTYASQVLSTGTVSAEWLANQLGHANTQMIHQHYGKFIPKDAMHIIQNLANALQP